MSETDFGQQILEELKSGEVSPEMKMALAQGMLPLDQNDLLHVLFVLCVEEDREIAKAAQRSLNELPDSVFIGIAEAHDSPAELLHSLARLRINSVEVLRRLVLNKMAEDQTIELIARNCEVDEVLTLVTGNQERLLRHLVLFDVLLANPGLAGYKRQQLATYKQELQERGQFAPKKPEPVAAPVAATAEQEPEPEEEIPEAKGFDLDLIADFELGESGPFGAEEMVPFDVYAGLEKLSEDARSKGIYQLLATMNAKEKLRMAMFGNAEVRNILIRDGDRNVASSVLKNPKIQENDIERFARMRNINDEILRDIGSNRQWKGNYGIVQGLVENPRTPLAISMGLLHMLRDQHVRLLVRNREVPLALRTAAGQKLARKIGGTAKH